MTISSIFFHFIAVYSLFLLVLFFAQRSLIYFPDKTTPSPINGVEVVSVTTADNLQVSGWYFPLKNHDSPTILFFHGNGGNHGHRYFKAQYFIEAGYNVLLAGYRGYGGNTGRPSEEGFYSDGRAYTEFLIKEKGIKPENIFLYGESIGSGTAVQMATEYDVAALILESPFSSLLERAKEQYFFVPVELLLKDRFLNSNKIKNINAPLFIVHGNKDGVVPYSSGYNLYNEALEPKFFKGIPQGNHNDLYEFEVYKHVLDFIAGITVNNKDNITSDANEVE